MRQSKSSLRKDQLIIRDWQVFFLSIIKVKSTYAKNVRVVGGECHMEQKPIHYDGSLQLNQTLTDSNANESFQITDEMRTNIGRNPYYLNTNE